MKPETIARGILARLAQYEADVLARIPDVTDAELLAILKGSALEEMRAIIETIKTEADRQIMAQILRETGHTALIGYLMSKELPYERR